MLEAKNVQDYLHKSYARVLVPEETGGFSARILEFPGCVTRGETRDGALESLEKVAESWLEVAIALGHTIAEPLSTQEYSGKVALRLPRWLHEQLARIAEMNHISANQFIIAAIAEKIGQHAAVAQMLPPIRQIVGESIRMVAERHFAEIKLPHAATAVTEVVQRMGYSIGGSASTSTSSTFPVNGNGKG